ncbi:MAG: peptidylprolyl isomerase [Oscillospiraceae bacterium]|nr:peptidylprolyl isomerase [Oscillospiraceae bacterium]
MKRKITAYILTAALICSGGCKAGNSAAVDVGKSQISKTDFEYYLESVKEEFKSDAEIKSDDDWNNVEIEGEKAIDAAKKKALDAAVRNALYIEIGKIKTPLTDSQQKSIDSFSKNMTSRMGGEENYKKFLEQNGMTDEFFKMLFVSETYRRNLSDMIKKDYPATDEEIKDTFVKNYRRAKHILIMTMDPQTRQPLSEEEIADAKKRADELYERVKNGEDFDLLMNEFSEDTGLTTNPDGYVFTDNEMVAEFQDGVDSLKVGEVCMVESGFGYHIIKRLALDETDEIYNNALSEKKSEVEGLVYNDKLNEKLEDLKKECGVEVKVNESYYKTVK